MFGVDAAGASRHRAFRIGVPARFPAGRPAAPHGGKAAMAGSHALRGFPILLEWESRVEEGWRPEIPPPQGVPPCRDLLWQRAAGSPASVGFPPIRATAGSVGRRKPHTRRGSPWMRLLSGAKRGEPRPAGDSPTASPRSLKGVPEAPHPRDSPHLFLQALRIKLPEIPYPQYSRQLGNPASPSLRGKSRARRVPAFSGKGAGLFSVRQQGRTGNSPCHGKGLTPSSLNPRE